MKYLGHPASFVVLYLLLMIPTYLLPWIGSNSIVVNSAAASTSVGFNPAFWLHLACIICLMAISWLRGSIIEKKWLIIFPLLAGFFDLVPGFNWIYGVPTMMHILVIILGVALSKVVRVESVNA